MKMHTTKLAIGGAAVALMLAACGTAGAEPADTSTTAPEAATTTMAQAMDQTSMTGDSMDHGSMDMNMGDADATPAYEVTGAAVVSGPFEALADSTADGITGTAWLARHTGGTTVTIALDGLTPGSQYVSHVHASACSEGGGPHYRHDPEGSEHAPNEIHLAFIAGSDGEGMMTVENPTVASDVAVSIVVHESGDGTPKLACADLSN
ncbi:MAG: superoxide dismutase family protein [Acidimicrobiia bacterium]